MSRMTCRLDENGLPIACGSCSLMVIAKIPGSQVCSTVIDSLSAKFPKLHQMALDGKVKVVLTVPESDSLDEEDFSLVFMRTE